MFRPLNETEISQIVRIQIQQVARRLQEQGVHIQVDETAVQQIARVGFDPEFGARPVKRALQRLLLNDLSKALLSGNIDKTRDIVVRSEHDAIVFENK